MKKPIYSIILPIRNEDESLPQLFDEIEKAFLGFSYEIIAVDDASGMQDHPGKWTALRTGIKRAKGKIIITIDADLQDDPKELLPLLKKLDEGFDVVSGWRKDRRDSHYKLLLTKIANFIFGFHDFASPMKVYRRNALLLLPQEGSFLRYSYLFAHLLELRTIEIPVVHRPRKYGQSKFGMIKYFRIFYDLILITLLFRGSGHLHFTKK